MIDIHTHVVYGVDDGARDFEESIEMIKMAVKDGTHGMVATSHYLPDAFPYEISTYEEHLENINKYCIDNKIDMKVYSGNELFLSPEGIKDLETGKCKTYNDTPYVLVEISNFMKTKKIDELLDIIAVTGKKIVLAHVERIRYIEEDFNIIKSWYNKGYVFQINGSSIIEKKHIENYKNAHKLLKFGYVHVIASDGHRIDRRKPVLKDAYDYIGNILGIEAADLLFEINPDNIIHNKDVTGLNDINLNKNYTLKRVLATLKGAKNG